MKKLFLSLFILTASFAQATSYIAARADDGNVVVVTIEATGNYSSIQNGKVEIYSADDKLISSYDIARTEIAMYYEGDDGEEIANVGLYAHLDNVQYQVSTKYFGLRNYALEPAELRKKAREISNRGTLGSTMRVWKGDRALRGDDAYYDISDRLVGYSAGTQ